MEFRALCPKCGFYSVVVVQQDPRVEACGMCDPILIFSPPGGPPMTKLYLAGPMTGIPEYNYPLFRKEAHALRTAGFEVLSPAELGLDSGSEAEWRTALRKSITQMLQADAVAYLPGWQQSRGCQLEFNVADALGIPVKSVAHWLDRGAEVPS